MAVLSPNLGQRTTEMGVEFRGLVWREVWADVTVLTFMKEAMLWVLGRHRTLSTL